MDRPYNNLLRAVLSGGNPEKIHKTMFGNIRLVLSILSTLQPSLNSVSQGPVTLGPPPWGSLRPMLHKLSRVGVADAFRATFNESICQKKHQHMAVGTAQVTEPST